MPRVVGRRTVQSRNRAGSRIRTDVHPLRQPGRQASVRPKEGDFLIKSGDASKTPLTPEDIPRGAMQTMAWAMDPADQAVRSGSRLNQLLLLRFDPEKLGA